MINADLVGLQKRKDCGLITDKEEKEMREKKRLKKDLEDKLKVRKNAQIRSQKHREKRRTTLATLCEADPAVKAALNLKEQRGRPSIEEDQPGIVKAIIDLAIHGSAAHEKRQTEVYRSIRTLDELSNELLKVYFKMYGTYKCIIILNLYSKDFVSAGVDFTFA